MMKELSYRAETLGEASPWHEVKVYEVTEASIKDDGNGSSSMRS